MTEAGGRRPLYEDIERQALSHFFGRFLGFRLAISPVFVVAAIVIYLIDPVPWRRWTVTGVAVAFILLSYAGRARFRGRGLEDWAVPVNVWAMAMLQLVMVLVTGALESPMLPAVFALAAAAGVAMGRRRGLLLVLGTQIAALVLFAAGEVTGFLPDVTLAVFGGGHRAGHSDALLWTSAVIGAFVLVAMTAIASGFRSAAEDLVRRALSAREDALATHVDQARALQALSGEIAHELKNPLASVKGLAALVARDLPTGRAAERLAVLRTEVERMQGILDDFLNFSRPLVPLTIQRVGLTAVCSEVADLHEAVARQAQVVLMVAGSNTEARCDRRKVKQVLINLVQNAIEASPPGGAVHLRTGLDGDFALVRVVDQGSGPSDLLGPRCFDPGVTDKAGGSGLGLTIARAIARQHGGELQLEGTEDGCTATLRLPAGGPPEAP